MSGKMALVPTNVGDAMSMSEHLAKSKLVPEHFRGKPEDVFLALNYGLELGLGPAASLRAISVIKGTPALRADAMVGLALSSGHAEFFRCVESDGEKATYETKRKGSPQAERKTFTIEDARTAGLAGSNTYKSYPKHMLEARAKSWLARDVYPDLLHGIYSSEEVSEFADAPVVQVAPEPSGHAEFSAPAQLEAPTGEPGTLDKLKACDTKADANSLVAELKTLTGDDRKEAERIYRGLPDAPQAEAS